MESKYGIILKSDSYKVSHAPQYPPGTQYVYSYLESRGGQFDNTVFFGLQYYLRRYLEGCVVTQEHIDRAAVTLAKHFLGNDRLFNREGWEIIVREHGGRLPLVIKAVPEGTPVPLHNVLMTVENTDPRCWWLTNYVETLLMKVWYPTTVATLSREIKRVLLKYLEETGRPELVDFKLHDFGCRGVSSDESAAIGGAGHLVNFKGTDTLPALELLEDCYHAEMGGFSIPAAEHSTIIAWGRDHEADAYERMLDLYPSGLVSVVSDSYDVMRACREIWGAKLHDKVMARHGTLVVRPDTGDPPRIVPEVLDTLAEGFPPTVDAKGYKVLPPQIAIIQGDGVDYDSIGRILEAMKQRGWSADNIAFGMGGALLQKLNRDTQEFAFKASHVVVNGEGRDVWKDPESGHAKASKPGRLKLVRDPSGGFHTEKQGESDAPDSLVEAFRDGITLCDYNLEEIRTRAALV